MSKRKFECETEDPVSKKFTDEFHYGLLIIQILVQWNYTNFFDEGIMGLLLPVQFRIRLLSKDSRDIFDKLTDQFKTRLGPVKTYDRYKVLLQPLRFWDPCKSLLFPLLPSFTFANRFQSDKTFFSQLLMDLAESQVDFVQHPDEHWIFVAGLCLPRFIGEIFDPEADLSIATNLIHHAAFQRNFKLLRRFVISLADRYTDTKYLKRLHPFFSSESMAILAAYSFVESVLHPAQTAFQVATETILNQFRQSETNGSFNSTFGYYLGNFACLLGSKSNLLGDDKFITKVHRTIFEHDILTAFYDGSVEELLYIDDLRVFHFEGRKTQIPIDYILDNSLKEFHETLGQTQSPLSAFCKKSASSMFRSVPKVAHFLFQNFVKSLYTETTYPLQYFVKGIIEHILLRYPSDDVPSSTNPTLNQFMSKYLDHYQFEMAFFVNIPHYILVNRAHQFPALSKLHLCENHYDRTDVVPDHSCLKWREDQIIHCMSTPYIKSIIGVSRSANFNPSLQDSDAICLFNSFSKIRYFPPSKDIDLEFLVHLLCARKVPWESYVAIAAQTTDVPITKISAVVTYHSQMDATNTSVLKILSALFANICSERFESITNVDQMKLTFESLWKIFTRIANTLTDSPFYLQRSQRYHSMTILHRLFLNWFIDSRKMKQIIPSMLSDREFRNNLLELFNASVQVTDFDANIHSDDYDTFKIREILLADIVTFLIQGNIVTAIATLEEKRIIHSKYPFLFWWIFIRNTKFVTDLSEFPVTAFDICHILHIFRCTVYGNKSAHNFLTSLEAIRENVQSNFKFFDQKLTHLLKNDHTLQQSVRHIIQTACFPSPKSNDRALSDYLKRLSSGRRNDFVEVCITHWKPSWDWLLETQIIPFKMLKSVQVFHKLFENIPWEHFNNQSALTAAHSIMNEIQNRAHSVSEECILIEIRNCIFYKRYISQHREFIPRPLKGSKSYHNTPDKSQ